MYDLSLKDMGVMCVVVEECKDWWTRVARPHVASKCVV